MNAVLDQLRINLRHAEACRGTCYADSHLWKYYQGQAVAYQHAIELVQGMIEYEAEKCKSK